MTRSGSQVLLLGASPQVAEQVRSGLADLVPVAAEREPLRGVKDLNPAATSVVVLVLDQVPEVALRAAETLAREHPQVPVLAVAWKKDPDLILRAMKARVRDFVPLSQGLDELRVAVQQTLQQSDAGEPAKTGVVAAVWPGRGGAGASVIGVNIAGLLARAGRSVVIVDLDLQLGDVLALLDLESKTPLSKVLQNLSRLDRELLESSLTRHAATGMFVLSEADQRSERGELDPHEAQRLIAFLRGHFDVVVLDGLDSLSATVLAALSDSSPVFMILTQDVPSLKNAHVRLSAYARAGLDLGNVRVVVNRHARQAEVGPDLISRTLELPVTATVADDPRVVRHGVNHATLLCDVAPRARVAQDIERLALMVAADASVTFAGRSPPEAAGGGLLAKLFGR